MKIIPINLATHIAGTTTTLANLLKITRKDGAIYAFTSADTDCIINNVLYKAAPGLNISSLESTAGFAVDNMELTTLDDGTVFDRIEIFGGVWRNASYVISRYNWANVSNGEEILSTGILGEIKILNSKITAELRGLQQYFQQPIGSVSSKTCRARLGDTMCTEALGPWTVTAVPVTSVTSNQVFIASSLAQATDYFTEGILTFTSGENIGISQKVKTHTTGGNITLSLPMFGLVQISDQFTIIAGCRKRLVEDCYTKFNNVINFQGEPHLPGIDSLSKAVK